MSEHTRPQALVVDDEPDIRELLQLTLERMDVDTAAAADLNEAQQWLQRCRFDLCLTDMRLPDGSGLDLIGMAQERWPNLPVAVITAHGSMESAVDALKRGAFDFVSKPIELTTLRELVRSALRLAPQDDGATAPGGPGARPLLGDSPAMRQIRAMVGKVARSQAPVYISGESGTGKELVARLIHAQGARAAGPFVPVNCGAIPEQLIESELFGHRKGSFTGATAHKDGLFQAAHGGTLFLDEIAELPLEMQVKLLRAIQEKAIRPVGAQRETHVDVRILSATHKDLGALVAAGLFRDDLFYRINVIELKVPPLRERLEDLPVLIEHILQRHAAETGARRVTLEEPAMARLKCYRFPGNVRELENILERALVLTDGATIGEQALGLVEPERGGALGDPVEGEVPLESYLHEVEREAIVRALRQTDHNKTAAAKRLGLTFRSLRYRLKKLGLD